MPAEICVPNPEFLIKSIAEQGYTLETSIADLIDNSISAGAGKIEVLTVTESKPFQMFLTDDGAGMTSEELKNNMHFPSASPEHTRDAADLGRFGLGLKTASFAQTRCLTVISKKPEDKKYSARTWDVKHLTETGKWEILINTDEEINQLLRAYRRLSAGYIGAFEEYLPNTIVVWTGLYKFERAADFKVAVDDLQREITETTTEHLSLIFHRFMERRDPLKIRVNNVLLKPFNPFPEKARHISTKHKELYDQRLLLEGYILPNSSIKESKDHSEWTLKNRSLMDMEGMYIYRAERVIVYGGWNGLIKKSPRLQLARLKVEVGNGIDHLFHLNVAKSSITIPFSERFGFIRYVMELKNEAEKEYFNLETKGVTAKANMISLFRKVPTTHGISLTLNEEFPLLRSLLDSLNSKQKQQFKVLLRLMVTTLNQMRKVHSDTTLASLVENSIIEKDGIKQAIQILLESGTPVTHIRTELIPALGIDSLSLPQEIIDLLQ